MISQIILLVMMISVLMPTRVFAKWEDLLNKLPSSVKTAKLADSKLGDGLKEALKVGINNAVKLTSQVDGFNKNDKIKISLPENFKLADKALRMVGFGPKLDEFVLSMNRAAEKAAPSARDIFIDSILNLSIDDAQKVFSGGETAATNYLKEKTNSKLKEAFLPIIKKSLDTYDVTKKYNELASKYNALALLNSKMALPSIDQYVLDKGLIGLFYMLGQEEAKIRKDPSARVTQLLKDVFK